ncbi:prepilin peptidase [Vibrio breoganii]
MSLIPWFVLIVIAVYDLSENRIPNIFLFLLLSFRIIEITVLDVSLLLNALLSLVLYFFIGLVLFSLRAMSPGDVKLLGVVGAYVGWSNTAQFLYYILMASGVVAFLFLLDGHSRGKPSRLLTSFANVKPFALTDSRSFSQGGGSFHSRYSDKLVMPFAPSVVIGLALFYYFT